MTQLSIGLLNKKRETLARGDGNVNDRAEAEVAQYEQALTEAGYRVQQIHWGPRFVQDLQDAEVDLVFNVSSLAEAAVLEELDIPYVGTDTIGIALTTDKSLTKRLWQQYGLPTSSFVVAKTEKDCQLFTKDPPFEYPLFVKPVAGRDGVGIDENSVVRTFEELVERVQERYEQIGQPVLVEQFLEGREIVLGVVGNGSEARVLPPLEVTCQEGDVPLTEEKGELDDDALCCPAPLTEHQVHMLELIALQAYKVLGMRDFARFDTILTDQGPRLLEANSFAGFTCTPPERLHSSIGVMACAEGKGESELLKEIVQAATRRLGIEDGE